MHPRSLKRTTVRLIPTVLISTVLISTVLSSAPIFAAEAHAEDPVAERARELLATMTVREKVGQLTQVGGFDGMGASEAVRAGAGSVLWLNHPEIFNRLQTIAVQETRLGIPLLFALDVVHGYKTVFPVPLGMAASWQPELYEATQAVAAREARAAGIHWTFAPMIDIARDARWGRMVEGAGEDPFLGSAMAAAQVRGLQGPYPGSPGRLIACAKHFVGYGASEGGRDYDPVYLPETQLRNVHMPPFRAAVEAGVGSFMSAYMDLNNVPSAADPFLFRQVLREEWGFDGFVVSDAFGIGSLLEQGFARDGVDAARRALLAGLNVDMASHTYSRYLARAVEQGGVTLAQLDDAVRPILEAKIRLGLFETPYVDVAALGPILSDPAHREMARRAARASMVLLRNEDRILPLAKDAGPIAVIGPVAHSPVDTEGSWTVLGSPPTAVTVLDGIRAAVEPGVEVTYAPGPQIARDIPSMFASLNPYWNRETQSPEEADRAMQEAVETAQAADVVVLVMGETALMSGEAASRASLDLPGRQLELLQAIDALGKPMVLVLINGRPLTIPWAAENIPAILEAWQPGSEGGHAVADVLFGDFNPGGKLPVTFPRDARHAPLYYARNRSHEPETSHSYSARYWDGPPTPLFPFGYGLSYTTFAYSNLRVDRPRIELGESATVSVDVTNIGKVSGDEVAQLYIHQRWGSDSRPKRELKGFKRLTLDAGETRTVHFELGPEELSYWSTAQRTRIQEISHFDLWTGGDSTTLLHTELAVGVAPRTPDAKRTRPFRTEFGPVVGQGSEGVVSFRGIPYAAPPVGDLRWRPPQAPATWTDPLQTTEFGQDCMQKPFPSDAAPLTTIPAEDCLYLNIWMPEDLSFPLPVMVWIHGGGYVNGGTSPEVYDGSEFARRGVVFVSFNYRLGRFGFFAHPALTDEDPGAVQGNYGFLDQIAALAWVQRNIAAFGGDPRNVTLFGESAGGDSVHTLMVSPRARGLFHRAIVQSGGGRSDGIMAKPSLEQARILGEAFAAEAGLDNASEGVLDALRALPAESLVNGLNLLNFQPKTYAGPMIDGILLPMPIETAFRAGQQAPVPYLVGANDREFGFSDPPLTEVERRFAAFGEQRDVAIRAYDPLGQGLHSEMGVQVSSDQTMVEPARLLARLAARSQPTWSYRFGYVASSERATQPGALHASELPFVFGTVQAKYGDATTDKDLAMAAVANAYWAAFARGGDPDHVRQTNAALPHWPRYEEETDLLMLFESSGPTVRIDPRADRLDLVEDLASSGIP